VDFCECKSFEIHAGVVAVFLLTTRLIERSSS